MPNPHRNVPDCSANQFVFGDRLDKVRSPQDYWAFTGLTLI